MLKLKLRKDKALTMDNGLEQLVSYITQQFHQGATEAQVRQSLLYNNWDEMLVNKAIASVRDSTQGLNNHEVVSSLTNNSSLQKHKVRNGVLWILSPFIILISVAILNILFRFAGISSPIINIIFLLAGMAGIILIFVGPILGIIKLTSRK